MNAVHETLDFLFKSPRMIPRDYAILEERRLKLWFTNSSWNVLNFLVTWYLFGSILWILTAWTWLTSLHKHDLQVFITLHKEQGRIIQKGDEFCISENGILDYFCKRRARVMTAWIKKKVIVLHTGQWLTGRDGQLVWVTSSTPRESDSQESSPLEDPHEGVRTTNRCDLPHQFYARRKCIYEKGIWVLHVHI